MFLCALFEFFFLPTWKTPYFSSTSEPTNFWKMAVKFSNLSIQIRVLIIVLIKVEHLFILINEQFLWTKTTWNAQNDSLKFCHFFQIFFKFSPFHGAWILEGVAYPLSTTKSDCFWLSSRKNHRINFPKMRNFKFSSFWQTSLKT